MKTLARLPLSLSPLQLHRITSRAMKDFEVLFVLLSAVWLSLFYSSCTTFLRPMSDMRQSYAMLHALRYNKTNGT